MSKSQKKVIYVDFKKGRNAPGKLGGGPKLLVVTALSTLVGLIVLIALARPQWLTAAYFAPTAIAVSVAVALGVRKLFVRYQVNYMHRAMQTGEPQERRPEDHTIH